MTALRDLPALARADADVKKILHDPTIGHRPAATQINVLRGPGTTTEKSVRRYREKRMSPQVLTSPYAQDSARPKTGSVPGWNPGIDIDPAEGGEFRTVPVEVSREAPAPEPEEAVLLEQFDLDPAVWEITAARKSQWQSGDRWLEARRVSFRKRGNGLSLTRADIDGIMSAYITPLPPTSDTTADWNRIVMVPSGDLQLGKQDGGGTAATINRFCRITDDIRSGLTEPVGALILSWNGDCIEGLVSQNGTLIAKLDISVTEQVRVYRRLMMHQIATLAPLAGKVLIPVVPGNHDETTRVQAMPMTDSWAIEGASAVADWMSGRPEYAHVEFLFPDPGEPGVTVDVGPDGTPYVISFIHGHTTGNRPDRVLDWWKGQAHGRQQAGHADMLVSAHYHHLRIEHSGGRRTWIQIPALDGGSDWYRHRTGEEAITGIVSMDITPGKGQGWRDLTVHS